MIRYVLALLFILFPALAEAAGQPSASRVTSPGGIAFTLIAMPGAKKIAITAAWASDWAYRTDVNPAAAAVGARLIFAGGAEGYPAGKAGEQFADLKAEAGLTVTADHVIGVLLVPREHIEKAAKIVNAHLRAPTFDATWFKRIRQGLTRQITAMHARPEAKALDAATWAVLGDQPLAAALILADAGLFKRLTRKEVIAWHKETFTRAPAALVVAGDLDVKAAGTLVDALFAGLPAGKRISKRTIRADYAPRRILVHAAGARTSVLALIAPLPPMRKETLPEQVADLILATALSRPDGPIFSAVREQLQATYGLRVGLHLFTRENRVLFLTGRVKTDKLAEAEQAVRKAYAAFRKNGPAGKLDALKARLLANSRAAQQSPLRLAHSELQGALDGFAPGSSLKVSEAIKALTKERLLAHLKQAFPKAEDFLVIAVSPKKNALPGACVITRPEHAHRCR